MTNPGGRNGEVWKGLPAGLIGGAAGTWTMTQGQNESWSPDQQQLPRELSAAGKQYAIGTEEERQEVADAIRKSLHRLTLRQGEYAERSTLVHGSSPEPITRISLSAP